MNEKEARQHVRDTRTVEKAISDAKAGEYNTRVKIIDFFLPGHPTDEALHDDKVYNAAYKEAKKKH